MRCTRRALSAHLIRVAVAETTCPLEFLVTPDRKAEEVKSVGVRNVPLTSTEFTMSRMSWWDAARTVASSRGPRTPSWHGGEKHGLDHGGENGGEHGGEHGGENGSSLSHLCPELKQAAFEASQGHGGDHITVLGTVPLYTRVYFQLLLNFLIILGKVFTKEII